MKKNLMTLTYGRACSRSTKRTSSFGARLIAAVLCCAMTVTMSLTSCSQSDNSVDPQPVVKEVAMADVVTLNAAPHALFKLGTKEMLPIYIAVNSAYKDAKGETQFYDLSKVIEVKVDADMFDLDTSHLAENGYIKLTPNPENEKTQNLLHAVETYGIYGWETDITITLTNIYGEKLATDLHLSYLSKNEQKEVLTIKKSDLNEKNELILDPAVISQFGLGEWPNTRVGDQSWWEALDVINAKLTDDFKVLIKTDGAVTDPNDPIKVSLIFTRTLTGSPLPLLPEGEGLMVNLHYELELNITE